MNPASKLRYSNFGQYKETTEMRKINGRKRDFKTCGSYPSSPAIYLGRNQTDL